MFLVSVSGTTAQLTSFLSGDNALFDPECTFDAMGQWTVVGYADETQLSAINSRGLDVEIIDDEATVDAEFDAALGDIEDIKFT